MNHLKLTTAPLFLVLLAGCAKPGLRSVNPYGTELVEANLSIRTQQLELKLPHFCGQFTAFESSHI